MDMAIEEAVPSATLRIEGRLLDMRYLRDNVPSQKILFAPLMNALEP